METKHCLVQYKNGPDNIVLVITYGGGGGGHADKLVRADKKKGQGLAPFFFNLAWIEWISEAD